MEILEQKVVGGQGYALMINKQGKYSIHISYANKDPYRLIKGFKDDKETAYRVFNQIGNGDNPELYS